MSRLPSILQDRVVVVTGAGSGIGAASARALFDAGARLVLVDSNGDAARDVAETIGDRAEISDADVTDTAALKAMVEQTLSSFGAIDAVFANAGVAAERPVTVSDTSDDEFRRIIEVNLVGVWRTVAACLPHVVASRGHVLITSSIYAFVNGMVNAPYAMTKAAVESYGRSLRAELAGTGATAGVLYPGWVDTPIIEASHRADSASRRLIDRAFPRPLRVPVAPEQVAAAVVDGIEARRARIVVPRRWTPVMASRGLVNMATDAVFDRSSQIHDLIREVRET